MDNKSILFLSALDFKEKSIQVIRKTPEAYRDSGWRVHYVVARDTSRHSNYCYEKIIELKGIKTYRFYWPLQSIRDAISSYVPLLLLTKLISLFVILKLAWRGAKILRTYGIDAVYGYEVHGVLAMNILSFIGLIKKIKKISRFQGSFIHEMLEKKQYYRILFNLDAIFALWLPSDLCIMTDDGTQGDKAVERIAARNLCFLKFWVNGVDKDLPDEKEVAKIQEKYQLGEGKVFISISRLVKWKRVDRAIRTLVMLKTEYNIKDFKYIVVGEGQERQELEILTKKFDLSENVFFIGAVSNSEVKNYLEVADYFISTYDTSNVGNPLLEAIRSNKIIFTLNNGDTNKWIQHEVNGFIYDLDDNLFTSMARDMYQVMKNEALRLKIVENLKSTVGVKLWSWEERFKIEVNAVEKLLIQ
jgi:glycosyltransferase involved in cell wall biosynthesis